MVELAAGVFSEQELQSNESRSSFISDFLPKLIETAKRKTLGFKENLVSINPKDIKTVED